MSRRVFSTSSYGYLAEKFCGSKNFMGRMAKAKFPDGESYHRFDEHVGGQDVVVVGGTISDAETMELYDISCAAVKYGAKSLAMVVPYFGYSTMDRATKNGEIVKAKTRARLLSSIPLAPSGNRIFMIDLHNEGIPHFFEGGIIPIHLYAKSCVMRLMQKMCNISHLNGSGVVIGSTDAGRAKWVQSLADELELDASFVFKRRFSGTETKIVAVDAHVKHRTVVVYDDMIRTGGSLVQAVNAYLDAGANEVMAITTHGLFCDDAFRKIARRVKSIGCTDTHPGHLRHVAEKKLNVASVDYIIAEALQGIDCGKIV